MGKSSLFVGFCISTRANVSVSELWIVSNKVITYIERGEAEVSVDI